MTSLLSALDELEKKAKDIEGYKANDVYHDHHVGCCFVRDGCREESDYKCEKVADFIESANRETVLKLIATVRVMREALAEFQLGHEHADGLDHIRIMGNTYGWCDYCSTKVTFGPGYAEAALAKAEEIWK